MATVHQGRNRTGELADMLGMSLGKGLSSMTNNYYMNKAINGVINDKSLENAPIDQRFGRLEEALRPYGPEGLQTLETRFRLEQEGQRQREAQAKAAKEERALEERSTALEKLGIPRGTPDSVAAQFLQQQEKNNRLTQSLKAAGLLEAGSPIGGNIENPQMANDNNVETNPRPFANRSNNDLIRMAVIPELKGLVDAELKQRQFKENQFKEDRKYHTGLVKDSIKEAEGLRDSIPKKESALNFARNAVETGNLSYFSPDKLADITGSDLFRTSKGAQLVTAGKESLLSNMNRVSAKAQNIWFEQRLNSMFPKIGQSKEANLTIQEMLEGEVALDKAYLNEFDRLEKEDEERYGFTKKDISRRAHDAIKDREKEIFKRSSYRMKEIEEEEKGFDKLKKEVGKPVPKGTPLTLANARLFKDTYGSEALKKAKALGYEVPSLEEFAIFQKRPEEFREELSK